MLTVTNEWLEKLRSLIRLLQEDKNLSKIENEGYIIYRVGKIIRIDIKDE